MSTVEAALIFWRGSAPEAGERGCVFAWRDHRDEELVVRPYQVDRREVAVDELALLSVQGQDARPLYPDDLAFEPRVRAVLLQVDRRIPRVPRAEVIAPEADEPGFRAEFADPAGLSACGAHAIPAL